MKPYKLGSVWVDLDHVLFAADEVTFNPYTGHGVYGFLQLAFQNEPWQPYLGQVTLGTKPGGRYGDVYNEGELEATKVKWAKFLAAWKTKDTSLGAPIRY